MPTGYTAIIQEGATFEKFVLACARNFGALIMMRDDPQDTPIPDEFKPSDHHIEGLKKATKELDRLLSLNEEEIKQGSAVYNGEQLRSWKDHEDKKLEIKKQYQEMLADVMAWEPPTNDHIGLKEFMVEQITKSIDWDCSEYERPEILTPKDWHDKMIASAKWSIDYHMKENEAEIKRSKERSEWVVALKQSLNLQTTQP